MSTNRRQFLAGLAALPATALPATVLPAAVSGVSPGVGRPVGGEARRGGTRSGRAKSLLVLGGTRFLGPPVVEAALAAGWDVTLFNRGKSNPELFPDLERLRGDRDTGDLSALKKRSWDAVVDTSGYVPAHVQQSAELLAEAVGRYVFVSTVSVYADQSAAVVGEDTAVAKISPDVVAKVTRIRQVGRHYGPLKALCEQAAERALPGRVANVRPGLIVGPRDSSDRFTYWPARIARGGEVLAPGTGEQEVQFVDVRDLGAWLFRLAAGSAPHELGVSNAVGFVGRVSMQELLHGCKIVSGADCSFTWVDEPFLLERKVRPYRELPLWLPQGRRGHFANARAQAAGLSFRPIGDTIRDTLAWHATRAPEHRWRAGMKAEREAKLLAEWRQR